MKLLKKSLCLTGEVIGISTEFIFKEGGNIINSIYNINKDKKSIYIKKKTEKLGIKLSDQIVKTTKVFANNADDVSEKVIYISKKIIKNSFKKETKIYGNSDCFYEEDKFIDVNYKINNIE